MSDIPASGGHWIEPRTGSSAALPRTTAYLLTDGSVEFLASGDVIPGGAIAATVQDSGDGTDEIVTPVVTTGRRAVLTAPGDVFLI